MEYDALISRSRTLLSMTRVPSVRLIWKEQLLPKHPMAEAVNYALNQWEALNNNFRCSSASIGTDYFCRSSSSSARETSLACRSTAKRAFSKAPPGAEIDSWLEIC